MENDHAPWEGNHAQQLTLSRDEPSSAASVGMSLWAWFNVGEIHFRELATGQR